MDSPKLAKKLLCLVLALAMTGCATGRGFGKTYQPIVDMKGEDLGKYNANLAECQQQYAQQVSAGKSAVAGAAVGAALGLAIGAIFHVRPRFMGNLAGTGAVSGGLSAGVAAQDKQETIIMRCLQGRGYRVLG